MWNNIKRNITIQYNAFVATTSLPGYKFTNCSEAKWIKLFWHVVLCMCHYSVFFMCLGLYYQYENSATLTIMEISDQGTALPYPSIYLCLGYPLHPEKLRNRSSELFQNRNKSIPLHEFDGYLQAAVRFQRCSWNDSIRVANLFKSNLDLAKIQAILPELYYQIDDWLKECRWKGVPTPCKNLFKRFETGPGMCYVSNSIYTNDYYKEDPNGTPYGTFTELHNDWSIRFNVFNISTILLMYLKHPRELLSLSDFPTYTWNKNKSTSQYYFTINKYYAENNVRTLRKSQRKCIYHDEVFPYENLRNEFRTNFYDKGLCLNYCHAMEFFKLCNCLPASIVKLLPDFSNRTMRQCFLKDIRCIEKHYLEIRQMKCDLCLANCNHTEYLHIPAIQIENLAATKNPQTEQSHDAFYQVNIDLQYWPKLQFRTLTIFSRMEYCISLMGLFGFVTGISFLNIFEIFYILFLRFPCSYYVNWDYLQKEFRKQEEEEKERSQRIPCIEMSLKIPLKN